jgi:hypothetical protein
MAEPPALQINERAHSVKNANAPFQNVYESKHPLVQHKLALLRQADTGVRRFRELVWDLAALLAYEALADLDLVGTTVTTPLKLPDKSWSNGWLWSRFYAQAWGWWIRSGT